MFRAFALAAAAGLTLAAAPAVAQDVPVGTVYAGPSVGYHDLGEDLPGDEGGVIYGGVIGFDVPVGSSGVLIGLEGNVHGGTGVVDLEYGAAARLGYKFPSGGVAYVRGGWQWVNVDIGNAAGVDIDDGDLDISDTADDYLVGVGGEFPLGDSKFRLRVGVDTVSFDSVRPSAALLFNF